MIFTLGRHKDCNADLDALQDVYESLDVEVIRLDSLTHDAVFHRDVAAWTPRGLIKCSMGKRSRMWEPSVWFQQMLHGNLFHTVEPPDTFEGADILWESSGHCYLACGQRTNHAAAKYIKNELNLCGIICEIVKLPEWHNQHLLGVMNTIGHKAYCVAGFMPGTPHHTLPHDEYAIKCSNWVVVKGNVIINEDCVKTIKLIEPYANVIPVSIKQLLTYEGGVACATGILQYDL